MRIIPFFYLALRVPIRFGWGTYWMGFGFLVRLGPTGWVIVFAAILSAFVAFQFLS